MASVAELARREDMTEEHIDAADRFLGWWCADGLERGFDFVERLKLAEELNITHGAITCEEIANPVDFLCECFEANFRRANTALVRVFAVPRFEDWSDDTRENLHLVEGVPSVLENKKVARVW